MRLKLFYLIILILIFGCTKDWENHYDVYPETVNKPVWEALQSDSQISDFVQLLKENQADTLFNGDVIYTVLAPTNEALSQYLDTGTVSDILINYHFLTHFIQSGNVQGKRKIQTLTEKFALFERYGSDVRVDGIEVESESPLYLDGKYFVLNKVATPRPNFYQFYKVNNPVLSAYIDSQDSIALDRELSTPIGFDEEGNTIYDSVITVFNKFELEFFPVSEEFRTTSATIVFPIKDDYENALTEMALNLGSEGYTSYTDIPLDWQYEILMPHLLEQGVFLNMIEPEEFMWKGPKDTARLLNILGDSIDIFYTPVDQTLLSNGYAYNYQDFTVPDSLYLGPSVFEAEDLLEESGVNKHSWRAEVDVNSDINIQPVQEFIPSASNDSILRVVFPKGYTGEYSIEFKTQNLFPRRYVMAIRTHMDFGGLYDIYVNDELVKTFDYYDFIRYRGLMFSVTGDRYVPEGRFNKFDMWVENITEYSRAKIKLEYKGPGAGAPGNGLVIDYIEFIPYSE